MMFERYTDRSRRVVVLAQDEARNLNHKHIRVEHLLLALITEGEGVGVVTLRDMGVDTAAMTTTVKQAIGRGEKAFTGRILFTPEAKKALESAATESTELGHKYIGTEHLLLGLVRQGDIVSTEALRAAGAPELHELRQQILLTLSRYTSSTGEPLEKPPSGLVAAFTTASARVRGRRQEIQRCAQTLTRHTRNSPVLIGEPGVGRRTVAAGLAHTLAAGDVPPSLRGKKMYEIDPSGAEVRTAMANSQSILWVEDLGAIGHQLRHAIIAGNVQIVSVATPESFASLDEELARCLQPIRIAEMDTDAATDVLHGRRDLMQDHHEVAITDDALAAVARAARFRVTTSLLPNSAIDLLDEICARSHPIGTTTPELDEQIAEVQKDKEEMIDAQDFETAARFRDREKELLAQRAIQRGQAITITAAHVDEVVRDLDAESHFQHREPRTLTQPAELRDPFAASDVDLWMIS